MVEGAQDLRDPARGAAAVCGGPRDGRESGGGRRRRRGPSVAAETGRGDARTRRRRSSSAALKTVPAWPWRRVAATPRFQRGPEDGSSVPGDGSRRRDSGVETGDLERSAASRARRRPRRRRGGEARGRGRFTAISARISANESAASRRQCGRFRQILTARRPSASSCPSPQRWSTDRRTRHLRDRGTTRPRPSSMIFAALALLVCDRIDGRRTTGTDGRRFDSASSQMDHGRRAGPQETLDAVARHELRRQRPAAVDVGAPLFQPVSDDADEHVRLTPKRRRRLRRQEALQPGVHAVRERPRRHGFRRARYRLVFISVAGGARRGLRRCGGFVVWRRGAPGLRSERGDSAPPRPRGTGVGGARRTPSLCVGQPRIPQDVRSLFPSIGAPRRSVPCPTTPIGAPTSSRRGARGSWRSRACRGPRQRDAVHC